MVVVKLEKILKPNKDTEKLEPVSLYMDGFLRSDLDFVRDRVINHNDFFLMIIDGRPGTGKSTLGIQAACYLNQKTNVDNVCFSLEQFDETLRSAKIGNVVQLDESFELNVKSSQSRANLRILSLLQQMREKKVFITIVLPCVYDLDKNVILSLCDMFIHCYREPFGRRGNYNAYDAGGLKKLWLFGRQSRNYSYKISKPTFSGRFTKNFVLDYKVYRKKKLSTLESLGKPEQGKKVYFKARQEERNKIVCNMQTKGKSVQEIGDLFDLKQSAVYTILKKLKDFKNKNRIKNDFV